MELVPNFSLLPYNTFGLDQKAKAFYSVNDENELLALLSKIKDNIYVLGGGSNILLTKDVDGIVLHNNIQGITILEQMNGSTLVEVSGGVNWHEFVLFTLSKNLGGLENLSLIPGTVGAAPIQNIGAYGVEQQDNFVYLEYVDLETLKKYRCYKADCGFGYRESVFKHALRQKTFITKVAYNLTETDHVLHTEYGAIDQVLKEKNIDNPTIKDVSNAVISIRQSKLPNPNEIGNAGSFFKNPVISQNQFEDLQTLYPMMPFYPLNESNVKIPAGWLIETAGLKGYRQGNVGVHNRQALVLVHFGNAKGKDVLDLANHVIDSVFKKFQIELHPEVNIW
ncbi:MAG: UDP-N-acetylmuramate dehydrogenase [Saprospiraceae bacterium]